MMPAFSAAIRSIVSPSTCWWSRPMEVITEASGVTMFVASRRPPSPVSQTTTSTPASTKAIKAITVVNSKKVG